MLSIEQANEQLSLGESLTKGPWVQHSRVVADSAKIIAEKCGMDGDRAYVFGLLHDIGRRNGSWGIAHIFDGYEYMIGLGEPSIARICLTHSFPKSDEVTDMRVFTEKLNCSQPLRDFLCKYLNAAEYDDHDRLIQLCDCISLPNGACIMEKRIVDVALRHGVRDYSLIKWRAFLGLKRYFDKLCGCNIYELLPRVVENSFADLF